MTTSRTMRWLKSGASARPGSGFGSLKPGLATASAHLLTCRRAQLLYEPPFVLRRPPPRRLDALGDQLPIEVSGISAEANGLAASHSPHAITDPLGEPASLTRQGVTGRSVNRAMSSPSEVPRGVGVTRIGLRFSAGDFSCG